MARRAASQYHDGMFGALRLLSLSAAGLSLGLAACAGAPVQTLSDTRQTLSAAEAAGAPAKAPAPYSQAVEELRQAEDDLKRHDYREAGRRAEIAHRDALQALHDSQPDGSLSFK